MTDVIFYILSAGAVCSALLMVTRKSAVPSALLLVLTFCFLSGLYLTLKAQFLAIIQVAVYAGAIMVLVIFVIMLLNLREDIFSIGGNKWTLLGILCVGAIVAQIVAVIIASQPRMPYELHPRAAELGTVESVGTALYHSYAFPFEMASVILVSAAVGAIVLAKKKLR